MYQKYTGVILKKHSIGEADELLTVYTREAGKLRVKSRSTRKVKSKLAGHLQSLNEVEFETARRHGNSEAIPVLTSVRIKTLNSYLRQDLQKFALALNGAETLYRLTVDNENDDRVYDRFVMFLQRLGGNEPGEFLVKSLQLQLLDLMGFRFDWKNCSNCRTPITREAYYRPVTDGLSCDRCRQETAPESAGLNLEAVHLSQIQDLANDRATRLSRRVEQVVESFLRYVLEREIRSQSFLDSLKQ